jgi:DtxR family Mn-dependent transcriptional regulator
MVDRAVEDYIKAIDALEQQHGRAKTSLLAQRLGVTPGSVTEMLKRLSAARPRLVSYKHHHGARLTAAGRRRALAVIRRHRLLETFLHKTLGLDWDEIHREAEELEHHLSDRVTEALDRHLGHPRFDPHGEPIPDCEGRMPDWPHQPLSKLADGQAFEVVGVSPVSDDLLVLLDRMGIGIRTTGRRLAEAAFDGSVAVTIDTPTGAVEQTLGKDAAHRIQVKAVEG